MNGTGVYRPRVTTVYPQHSDGLRNDGLGRNVNPRTGVVPGCFVYRALSSIRQKNCLVVKKDRVNGLSHKELNLYKELMGAFFKPLSMYTSSHRAVSILGYDHETEDRRGQSKRTQISHLCIVEPVNFFIFGSLVHLAHAIACIGQNGFGFPMIEPETADILKRTCEPDYLGEFVMKPGSIENKHADIPLMKPGGKAFEVLRKRSLAPTWVSLNPGDMLVLDSLMPICASGKGFTISTFNVENPVRRTFWGGKITRVVKGCNIPDFIPITGFGRAIPGGEPDITDVTGRSVSCFW